MPNSALERARKLRDDARQRYAEQQTGTPPVEPPAEPSAEPPVEPGQPEAAAPEPPAPAQDKADAPPAEEDTVAALRADLDKLRRSYDELRSHTDRVSGENGALRRENETLNAQIKVLLAGHQSGGSEPPKADPTPPPREGTPAVPAQQADESDEDYLARLVARYDDLRTADEDYGPIVRPLIKVIRDLERRVTEQQTAMRQQLDPVLQSAQTEIRQSAEERQQAAVRQYFAAIADKHADFRDVLASEAFAEFIRQHPTGATYHRLIWPEQWPEGQARRGSAEEIVGILDEFKTGYMPGQGAQQQQEEERRRREDERRRAAEAAAEPSVRPTQPQPTAEGEIIKRSDIIKWAKDPQAWKEHKQAVHVALMNGRIVEDVAR